MMPLLSSALVTLLLGLTAAAPATSPTDINAGVGLESRQNGFSGTWCEHRDFQGECLNFYVSPVSENRHIFVGNHWNDRISSVRVNSGLFRCSFYRDFNSNRCENLLFVLGFGASQLNPPQSQDSSWWNDQISCYHCNWA